MQFPGSHLFGSFRESTSKKQRYSVEAAERQRHRSGQGKSVPGLLCRWMKGNRRSCARCKAQHEKPRLFTCTYYFTKHSTPTALLSTLQNIYKEETDTQDQVTPDILLFQPQCHCSAQVFLFQAKHTQFFPACQDSDTRHAFSS